MVWKFSKHYFVNNCIISKRLSVFTGFPEMLRKMCLSWQDEVNCCKEYLLWTHFPCPTLRRQGQRNLLKILLETILCDHSISRKYKKLYEPFVPKSPSLAYLVLCVFCEAVWNMSDRQSWKLPPGTGKAQDRFEKAWNIVENVRKRSAWQISYHMGPKIIIS